ncbi:uncharacterized protein LOC117121414 isoform X2 [Anneissia japonica]|uniref:uncharacterized protein LOC117121414 isoform X2 n=1 Tax=Anneissia japonica TaxID=1529436 RepID=UPI0014258C49|nr:uncharacterized protein LOC117121414 isoform X2 [Anneissia japonica]
MNSYARNVLFLINIGNVLLHALRYYLSNIRQQTKYFCTAVVTTLGSSMEMISRCLDVTIYISSYTAAKNVTIKCSANGTQLHEICLFMDGHVIKTENDSPLMHKIDIVTESDGGSYKCTATDRFNLTKQSETKVLNYYPPEYVDYITVAPGENATIAPVVLANPNEVTYQWITELNDTDTDPRTFTFKASDVVGTNYTVTVNATNNIGSAIKLIEVLSVDYCVSSPCGNKGTCISANFEFTCECKPGYSGRYCENSVNSTSLTIGMLFVGGIIVGAFGTVIGGLIGYTRIKRKAQIGKRSANQRQNLDTYMDYVVDDPTAGNKDQTYQDLQHREEETAHVNAMPRKK